MSEDTGRSITVSIKTLQRRATSTCCYVICKYIARASALDLCGGARLAILQRSAVAKLTARGRLVLVEVGQRPRRATQHQRRG